MKQSTHQQHENEQKLEAILKMQPAELEQLDIKGLEGALEVLRRSLPHPLKRPKTMDGRTSRIQGLIDTLDQALRSKRAALDKRYSVARDGKL